MKTNNKKKGNTAKKLMPAAAMLAVSASMLATSTYAWFTMNKEVQLTGMQLKTKVGSNVLISSNNAEGSYSPDTLLEGRKVLLEPVSSVSGQTGGFYYTLDALDSGKKAHTAASGSYEFKPYSESTAKANALAGKNKHDATFNSDYGNTVPEELAAAGFDVAYGYADYVFYLKATADADYNELRMTKCDLNYDYNGNEEGFGTNTADKAWRVAVFAKELTSGQPQTGNTGAVGNIDPATEAAKTILRLDGAVNWSEAETEPSVKAVSGEYALSNVTYGTAAKLATSMTAGDHYYKVIVRIWLEGEDQSCNSTTYAALTDAWGLDLDFQLTTASESAADKAAVTANTKNAWEPTTTATQIAVTSPIEVAPAAAQNNQGGGDQP